MTPGSVPSTERHSAPGSAAGRVILAAQVGRAVTDHAVILDGDEDELVMKAMRGSLRNVTTACGKRGEARARVFDPDARLACGSCRRQAGG